MFLVIIDPVLDYLFYRLYRFMSYYQGRRIAAMLAPLYVAGLLTANLLEVNYFLYAQHRAAFVLNNTLYLGMLLVLLTIALSLFYRTARLQHVMGRFIMLRSRRRRLNNVMVIIYVVVTIASIALACLLQGYHPHSFR